MRTNEKRILILLTIMILIVISCTFFTTFFNYINVNLIVFLIISVIIAIITLGFDKDSNPFKIDIMQIIFIYSFTYLILTFISGLIFGFVKTPYNLNIIAIIKNTVPIIIIIVLEEIFKYIILKRSKKKLVIFLLFFLFTILEIGLNIHSYELKTPMDIFELIGTLILPTIVNNILAIYIIMKSGYLPAILYRIIFSCYVYLVPVIPDLGIYLKSVLGIVFPAIIFLRLNTLFAKKKLIINRQRKLFSYIILTPLIVSLIIIVSLVSNAFSYTAIAIASNSMKQAFEKGDVVIVKKILKDKIADIKIGDVLVYQKENITIVHRVTKINQVDNHYIYNTKGDNNNAVDNYDIVESDIIGTVSTIIPKIGYPSVWFSEQINK